MTYLASRGSYLNSGGKYIDPQESIVIDGFNYPTDDIPNYYTGSLTSFETDSNFVREGSRSLKKFKDPNAHRITESDPGDGLNYYPQVGDTIYYETAISDGSKLAYFQFFREHNQNNEDNYRFHLRENSVDLSSDLRNGGHKILAESSYSPIPDKYYTVVLDTSFISNGVRLDCYLFDGNNQKVYFRVDDTEYVHSGRALGWAVSGIGWYDNARVKK
jgi:hypothetical protein